MIPRLKFQVTFVVETRGERFPLRMLFRERAFPRTEHDANAIMDNLLSERATNVEITLVKYTPTAEPHILFEQWEDFGCTVTTVVVR